MDRRPPRPPLGSESFTLPDFRPVPQPRGRVHGPASRRLRTLRPLRLRTLYSQRPPRPQFRSRTSMEKGASICRRRYLNSTGFARLVFLALLGTRPGLSSQREIRLRSARILHAYHVVFALSQEDCSSRCLRSFQFLQFPHSRRGSDFGHATLAVVPGVLDVFLS